jgi:hypothetical protein
MSVESNDSNKGIIMKHMQYSVAYGTKSAGSDVERAQERPWRSSRYTVCAFLVGQRIIVYVFMSLRDIPMLSQAPE